MRHLLRSLVLLTCMTSLVWAEGSQYALTSSGVSPCTISWQEADSFNIYQTQTKGGSEIKIGSVLNSYESTPPKTWSWPCPTVPGQYYFTTTSVTPAGEGTRSTVLALMITDPRTIAVTSIMPNTSLQGTSVPVTITGTGFQTAGIANTLGVLINTASFTNVSSIVVVSDTQVTAVVQIGAQASVGTFDVVVGNTSIAGFLKAGFTIQANVPVPVPGDFKIGVNITTKPTLLNVRATPNGTILGVQFKGAKGKIVDGPIRADNVTWWKLDYATGVDGWSSEAYLTIVP